MFSHLHAAPGMMRPARPGRDVLALLCPDWRGPCVAIEAATRRAAYANWRALRMFDGPGPVHITGGRLSFNPASLNRRFYARLERALAQGEEKAAIEFHDALRHRQMAAIMHIPHGFTHDVLTTHLGPGAEHLRFAIIEFTIGSGAT